MSDSSALSKTCPKCGAALPSDATEGLCPNCLMLEAMDPTLISDAVKPKRSAILSPEELAPFFPQYEIMRMLGRGGMGAVYLARQISLNRLVAIKLLPADMNEGEVNFAERFKNEAQAMAQLNHPGIVGVYDFGETSNGLLYIVMEYVEGTDVQLMLASQGRLHSAHAMAITAHVCDALQYAHSRGIIHRDIKPSNIMVSNDGVVKVADFGLAKMSHGQTTGLTGTGMAMGTLHFMAPEALTLGTAVDQRADIYAVGVMLYQMLTGKLPQGMFEMPSFQVAGLDPRYDRIVARALRDDREQRYQAALELRHDLDAILTQPVEKVVPEAVEVKALPPVEERGKKGRQSQLPKIEVGRSVPTKRSLTGIFVSLTGAAAVVVAGWFVFGGRKHEPGSVPASPSLGNMVAGPDTAHATPITKIEEASIDHPFVNTLGMRFVPVPGTKVMFCIHETRNSDYAAYAKENPGLNDAWQHPHYRDPQNRDYQLKVEDDHPVIQVTWDAAKAFCRWLSLKEGRTYRLPTDHEWSCAAGLGGREDAEASPASKNSAVRAFYPWGTEWPPPPGAGNFADRTWAETFHQETMIPGYSDGFPATAPVMSFKPNFLGLYDLAGNVSEYCDDWYDSQHKQVVGRGGHWTSARPQGDVLSSGRLRIDQPETARAPGFGFRCVVEAVPNAPARAIAGGQNTAYAPTTIKIEEASIEHPFVNSLGMKFVPVPGTKVLFSIWDTRVRDYLVFANENNVDGRWKSQNWDGVPIGSEPNHPVVAINWEDAQAFCEWLTRKETSGNKISKGARYRLPTDAEWSLAVGLGPEEGTTPREKMGRNSLNFPWGLGFPPKTKVGNYADETFHAKKFSQSQGKWIEGYDDGHETTSPVGSFPANVFGLYDMGGNVWQWCEDWMDSSREFRVLRGASWDKGSRQALLSANRASGTPITGRGTDYGFRCVLEIETADANGPDTAHATPTTKVEEASVEHPFANSLGMKFVPVPGTKVQFCIHEARYKDYAVYAAEAQGVDGSWKDQSADGFIPTANQEEHPVMRVSWEDAQKFCAWLSKKEGKTYRLPTDEEWSIAVGLGRVEQRSPDTTPAMLSQKENALFPWGGDFPPKTADQAGNYSDASRKEKAPDREARYLADYDDGFPTTAPVMSFRPNQFGLYDMGGNVWEWCEDWFDNAHKDRVLRGGSWNCDARSILLSSSRAQGTPGIRYYHGFRLVLVPESAPAPEPQVSASASAHTAKKDAPFINSLGMKFVPVPITGGPTDGKRVLFSIWETRVQDFEVFAKDTKREWPKPGFDQGPTHPAVMVSRDDAQAFCQWLTVREQKAERIPTTERYRLPSDHEWSCVVGIAGREDPAWTPEQKKGRIGDAFPWGSVWPPPQGAGNFSGEEALSHETWKGQKTISGYRDNYPQTAPTGSFAANSLGLFDLGGNAWEWCEDWFNAEHRQGVLRGGSFIGSDRPALTSSARFYPEPANRDNSSGFRCVLAPAGP